jgi:hypothetical protein
VVWCEGLVSLFPVLCSVCAVSRASDVPYAEMLKKVEGAAQIATGFEYLADRCECLISLSRSLCPLVRGVATGGAPFVCSC